MIRKLLLLPVIATALLAGCATYSYRSGSGDYYYGQPGTHYRVYGSYGYPGAYGYGYPGYYGYPGTYGYYGYGYGSPYWGGGYYPRYPSRPHGGGHHDGGSHHPGDHQPPPEQGQPRPDRPRPPWRDLDGIARPQSGKRQVVAPGAPATMAPQRTAPVQDAVRVPRPGGWKRDNRRTPVP